MLDRHIGEGGPQAVQRYRVPRYVISGARPFQKSQVLCAYYSSPLASLTRLSTVAHFHAAERRVV